MGITETWNPDLKKPDLRRVTTPAKIKQITARILGRRLPAERIFDGMISEP
jgi:hypothetical protein